MSLARVDTQRRWTIEEFLAWQAEVDERYELVDGFPVRMMSPTMVRHDRVVMNLTGEVLAKLRSGPCEPFSGEGGIETFPGQIRRPDFGIDCGETDDDSYLRSNPTLVAEVFSPSTRRFDLAAKLPEYQFVRTVRHILYIDPSRVDIAHWSRDANGSWQLKQHTSVEDRIALSAFDIFLDVAALYRGIRLED